jgi:hypothetical protein
MGVSDLTLCRPRPAITHCGRLVRSCRGGFPRLGALASGQRVVPAPVRDRHALSVLLAQLVAPVATTRQGFGRFCHPTSADDEHTIARNRRAISWGKREMCNLRHSP